MPERGRERRKGVRLFAPAGPGDTSCRGPRPCASAGKRGKQPRAAKARGLSLGPLLRRLRRLPLPLPAPLVPALASSDSREPGRSAGAAAPPAGHLAQARPREGRQGVGLSTPTSRLLFKVKSLHPARPPLPPPPAALKPDVEAAATLVAGARGRPGPGSQPLPRP